MNLDERLERHMRLPLGDANRAVAAALLRARKALSELSDKIPDCACSQSLLACGAHIAIDAAIDDPILEEALKLPEEAE